MKKSHGILRLILTILIIFIVMLAVNTAVMSIFFHINVFDLRYVKDAILERDGNITGQMQSSEAGRNKDVTGGNRPDYGDGTGQGYGAGAGPDYGDRTEQDGTGTENMEDTHKAYEDGAGQDYGDGAGQVTLMTGADESGYYVYPEEIELLKYLSLKDKLAAISIISKIDRDIADRVYEMSKDGVTYGEFSEIKESVKNYLEPADVEVLEELFHRSKEIYTENNK